MLITVSSTDVEGFIKPGRLTDTLAHSFDAASQFDSLAFASRAKWCSRF
jgi:hypothetical protein